MRIHTLFFYKFRTFLFRKKIKISGGIAAQNLLARLEVCSKLLLSKNFYTSK